MRKTVLATCVLLAGAVATGPAWASPDLTITNYVLPLGTVSDGETIDYNITVSNVGDSAADSTGLTDFLPSSVSFLSAVVSGGSNVFSSSLDADIWTIGTLDVGAGASVTLTLAVEVLVSSGTISDTAVTNALNNGVVTATATTDVSATPLPAALPLFAGGLGFVGYLTGRKKRKAGQAIAAA